MNDKELLIKDLCGRLPYGVKVKTSYDKINEPIELRFINPKNGSFAIGSNFTLISGLDLDIYECKPYLFPLSSMTPEQRTSYNFLSNSGHRSFTGLIDFFNKNHLDYRGLIPKGISY